MLTLATHVTEYGHHWGHGGWWPIFPILWFLLIGFVVFAIFRRRRFGGPCHHGQSSESVLRERFARGEIEEDEYRKRLEVLRRDRK
jgi:putative membrane protein